ncbi:MAG: 50S ribosomal protein L24 [Candidatus Magnetobacterium sp. LHC-1]|uniref:Large ribosomal subunit protein uL24 n=1 Tax=Candidatus Magnetobacterium casense TaxID=1455061 RepID=A0ABS6RXY2_9BACT|nr:50S ribosomal protein L24 [Candidatus Magnetobacterium casensis]MBF0607820.1 50S ribosomal protein L24 [Nitrospirota bacterium]MBV6340668.1 50S ribosomal protein L24 [Candidatus Magnetobacterium casensis]
MGLSIKKEDTVVVLTGSEAGKKGRVIRVIPKKACAIVENTNMIKKHMKPNKQYKQGGIIEKEAPIDLSKLMLICPRCSKPTRIGNQILDGGKKIRLCKKCKEVID